MKKVWAFRKDAEAVSPVIATILMVAITVVLAAVLYVMVLGFGTGGTSTPSVQISSRTTTADGYKWQLTAPTSEVTWTDFTVILQSGTLSSTWNTATQAALTGDGLETQELGAMTDLGPSFWLNITDIGGNGIMSNGDYFTIEGGFAPGTAYTVILMHEPTDGQMVSQIWTA